MPDDDDIERAVDEALERDCLTCGRSLSRTPYEFWLFRTCRSCAAEPAPDRWGDGRVARGTARKWAYYPKWHFGATHGGGIESANQLWRCLECGETVKLRAAQDDQPEVVFCPECTLAMYREEP